MNIRNVVLNDWPKEFEEDTDIENYVTNNANNVDKLKEIGCVVQDMTVPDGLDEQLVTYLGTGFAFSEWFNYGVDIHQDYYQNWVFVEKDGTRERLQKT